MTRLIDADALEKVLEEKHFKRVLDSDRWLIADIKKSIMDLPTIDAVPVIRCKDCKNWEADEDERCMYCGEGVLPKTEACMGFGYCSMAEPKETS